MSEPSPGTRPLQAAPELGTIGRLLDSSRSAVLFGVALTGLLAWLLHLRA
jgi:hypothetical protein